MQSSTALSYRRKYQAEVDRICSVANLKQFQLQEKIKHCENQLTSQLSSSKVSHQAQQTLPEDFPIINPEIDDSIDTTPNQKDISTQTFKNIDTAFTQTDPEEPRTILVKNIDTVSSETDEDEVVLEEDLES